MSKREEKTEKKTGKSPGTDSGMARRPQYGMGSNIMYMLRLGREVPGLLPQRICLVLAGVVSSVAGLYMSPTLLRILESRRSLHQLLAALGGFVLVLLLAGGIKGYLEQQGNLLISARQAILDRMNAKAGTCSYPLLQDDVFLGKWEKGRRATSDNSAAAEDIWRTLSRILENGICFLIYLALLTQVKPFLILVTLATASLGYWITYCFVRRDYRFQEEASRPIRGGFWVFNATRNPKLAKDVRIFGMRQWLEGMYAKYRTLAEDIQKRRTRNNIVADLASLALDILRNGIAYAYLLAITLQGNLSAGEFLLYFTAVMGFSSWITGILGGFTTLHRQSMEISMIREFCEFPEPFKMEGGKELTPDSGAGYELELRDVSYRYPTGKKPVLEHLNLKIRPGEKLAVVGVNGAGKTTLIKLLCGFLDPDQGTVLLNGVDIREYNRREYYSLFAAVFQDFSILGGSIADNVAQYTSPDFKKVWSCLERAGVKERIERLPGGLDAKLEKRVYPEAVELSGGEMQRLMMARMLYKEAPVLILDEPTAALDALAEQDVYERYNELSQGRTSVYISHRLASTRFCDRVILIENGGIREEGSHEQLIALGGRYAQLFRIQSKYYREEEVGEDA